MPALDFYLCLAHQNLRLNEWISTPELSFLIFVFLYLGLLFSGKEDRICLMYSDNVFANIVFVISSNSRYYLSFRVTKIVKGKKVFYKFIKPPIFDVNEKRASNIVFE